MKFMIQLLSLLIAVHAVAAVFWNVRPKFSKVRLRPPRHHHDQPPSHISQQALHRAHHVPVAHFPPPTSVNPRPAFTQHVPIRTYRLPFMKPSTQPMTYITNRPHQHHLIKRPLPMNKIMSTPSVNEIEMQNFVENSDIQASSDGTVHGYLSPSYKGWRPIAKPNYLYQVDSDMKQSSTTSDYYVYPTTEIYQDVDGKHQQLYLNTLYRHNVNSLKPLKQFKLKSEYSENQNVAIPPPSSFQHFHSNNTPQKQESEVPKGTLGSFSDAILQVSQSQSEGETSQRKPFPRFQHPKLKRFNTTIGALVIEEQEPNQNEAPRPPPPPKFKISRPRLRGQAANGESEAETVDRPGQAPRQEQTIPTQFSNENQHNQPLNLKGKISNSNKVRKRVKVGIRQPQQTQPQAYVNTDELGNAFNKDGSSERPGPIISELGSQELQFHNVTSFNGYHTQTSPQYDNYFDHGRVSPSGFTNSGPSHQQQQQQTHTDRYQHHHHINEMNQMSQPNINPVRDPNSAQQDFNQENPARLRPKKREREREREQPKETVVYNEDTTPPAYNSNDFFLPTDFFKSTSASGQDPVSFMAVDMGYAPEKLSIKPKMIHHSVRPNQHQHGEQRYPIITAPRAPEHPSPRPEPIRFSAPSNFNQNHLPSNFNQNHPPPVHRFVYMNNPQHQQGHRNSFQSAHHAPTTYVPAPQHYETTLPPPHFQPTPFPQNNFIHTNHPNLLTRPPPLPPSLPHSTMPSMSFFQTFKQTSTTPRNPQHFTTQSNHPQQVFEFKIAKAPNLDNANLVHPEANSLVPVNHVFNGKEKQFEPYYVEPNSFSMNEYERIPMEFINELRPILMDDELIRSSPPPPSTTTPHSKPKDIYRPPSFFESFFKPFNGRHRHPTKSPKSPTNPNTLDAQGSSSNSLNTYVQKPPTKFSSLEDPFATIFSAEEALADSPIHYVEYVNVENQAPKQWSKLKSGNIEVTFQQSGAKSEEVIKRVNENNAKASEETTVEPHFSNLLHQNIMHNNTLKQKQTDLESTTSSSYGNPSPLTNVVISSTNSISEDLEEESNTPTSVTTTTSTMRPKVRKVVRTRTSSVSEKSSRIFKRPLIKSEKTANNIDRTRFFSSRVRQRTTEKSGDSEVTSTSSTTHRPLMRRAMTTMTTSTTERPTSTQPVEFDSARVRPKRRRLIFRKPLRHTTPESTESEQVNSSSSVPPEDVTYGEGKWYQVPSSTEDAQQFASRRLVRNNEVEVVEDGLNLANTFSAAPLTATTPTSSTPSESSDFATGEEEEPSSEGNLAALIETQNPSSLASSSSSASASASSPKHFEDSVGETGNLTIVHDSKEGSSQQLKSTTTTDID